MSNIYLSAKKTFSKTFNLLNKLKEKETTS